MKGLSLLNGWFSRFGGFGFGVVVFSEEKKSNKKSTVCTLFLNLFYLCGGGGRGNLPHYVSIVKIKLLALKR